MSVSENRYQTLIPQTRRPKNNNDFHDTTITLVSVALTLTLTLTLTLSLTLILTLKLTLAMVPTSDPRAPHE